MCDKKRKTYLLPCPFCATEVTDRDILPQEGGWLMIRCWNCGVRVQEVTSYECDVAAKWNRRDGKQHLEYLTLNDPNLYPEDEEE